MNCLNELNPAQRAAVEYNDGPLLVIAGAGSGKTRVLTYKIAYLLEQGVAAGNILALTFTNKAAREMKARIAQLVGEENARYLWMGTFHSICARILRQEAQYIGYTHDYSIYDTADSKSLLKHIVKDMQLDEKVYKAGVLSGRISMAKNHLLSPTQYAANREFTMQDRFERLYEMTRVYTEYNRRLRAANAMDFDDLLFMTNELFRTQPEVLRKYQELFQYVLVDEYQDTNYAQYLIVKRLAEPQDHICVVGDDAQSIYSFRGADITNILSFQKGYEQAKLFKLERNYRSTQTIVNAANSLIRHNKNQISKAVYSDKETGNRLRLCACMTDRDEAQAVARQIRLLKKSYDDKNPLSYNDIAVMYRTNAQSRVLEDELRRLAIPYRIYGGTSFYQRKEVKDAIAYLRVAVNLPDNEALLRIINYPARGIGETTMAKISDMARQKGVSVYEVVREPHDPALSISPSTQTELTEFAEMMQRFAEEAGTKDAYTFASEMLHQSGLLRDAKSDTSPEGIARLENLQELLNGIHEFSANRQQQGHDFTAIADFLAEVSLLTDQDEHTADQEPRVTLLTVHAAKGLEFRVVFVVGLEENLFPSQFCKSARELEEERRLLYVAITRAMEQCYLLYARQRFRNGATTFSTPSRFIKDIESCFVRQVDSLGMERATPLSTPRGYKPTPATTARPSSATAPTNLKRTTGALEKTSRKSIRSEWKKDDRVNHRTFGDGTVLEVYRENENEKIDINFDTVGKKTLLLMYAKLTRLA